VSASVEASAAKTTASTVKPTAAAVKASTTATAVATSLCENGLRCPYHQDNKKRRANNFKNGGLLHLNTPRSAQVADAPGTPSAGPEHPFEA
jgi:hypothetical protein